MAFLSVIIPAAGALVGAGISAKASKDAAKTASAGSDKQIAYNRESRDIALDLQSPYREAGYSALDKIGGMTGLLDDGGSFGRPAYEGSGQGVMSEGSPWGDSPWSLGWDDNKGQYTASLNGETRYWDDSSSKWMSSTGSAYGGRQGGTKGYGSAPFSGGGMDPEYYGRAGGGVLYNVNELGPESVYSKGSYTRNPKPQTMPPDPTGYVHAGRAYGGTMIDPNSMGDSVGPTYQDYVNSGGGFNWQQDTGYRGGGYNLPSNVGVDKGGEFGWRDGIPSGKGNMSNNTIDVTSDVNQPGISGPVIDQGGVPIPQENPYNFQTDPGYQFRLNEGMRALESSAAARGGLLSGGFARKALRYGQDYASAEFSNIYNRLSNIAGLGQVSAQSGGNAALQGGSQMGAAAGQGALSSAYGQMGAANAWANAGNQIAQLPWDQVGGGGAATRPAYDFQGRPIQYD